MRRRTGGRSRAPAGSSTTCTKSLQCIEAAASTSAASGSSTMALRKKVVKPKVSPKPGRTLGLRKLMAAPRCTMSTGQRPPSSSARKRSAKSRRARVTPTISICAGRLGEAPRELLGDLAEAQLGAHLQAVRRLRFRARIEQRRACRAARCAVGVVIGKDADVHRLGRHVPQHARRHRERRAARRVADPVDQHALRRGDVRGQHQQVLRAPAQQPLGALRAVALRAAMTVVPTNSACACARRVAARPSCGSTRTATRVLHARHELRQQRLAAQRLGEQRARGAGGEARERRGQHVNAAHTDRDLLPGTHLEAAVCVPGARHLQSGARRRRRRWRAAARARRRRGARAAARARR